MENELVLRPPMHSDLPAVAALLAAEGFTPETAASAIRHGGI
jgi:hypothetical protein